MTFAYSSFLFQLSRVKIFQTNILLFMSWSLRENTFFGCYESQGKNGLDFTRKSVQVSGKSVKLKKQIIYLQVAVEYNQGCMDPQAFIWLNNYVPSTSLWTGWWHPTDHLVWDIGGHRREITPRSVVTCKWCRVSHTESWSCAMAQFE